MNSAAQAAKTCQSIQNFGRTTEESIKYQHITK